MPSARLTTSESLMLDIIRVVAACVVAFGHLTQYPFSSRLDRPHLFGAECSLCFFCSLRICHSLCHGADGEQLSVTIWVIAPLASTLWRSGSTVDMVHRHHGSAHRTRLSTRTGSCDYWPRAAAHSGQSAVLWPAMDHLVTPLSRISAYWSINYEVSLLRRIRALSSILHERARWVWIAALALLSGPRMLYLCPLWIWVVSLTMSISAGPATAPPPKGLIG